MPSLSAVIVAAGRSQRFNEGCSNTLSKQLLEWSEKPLFVHTLDALYSLPIAQLALVVRPEEEAEIHSHLRKLFPDRALKVVFGGARRQDSVRNGLMALEKADYVLVHDAARPFLHENFLNSLYSEAQKFDAVIPVMPIVETLKEVDANGRVVKTHPRNHFVRVQTPQFFKFELLKLAHEKLSAGSEEFTDDAALMEKAGYNVQTFPGLIENIKVTSRQDLPSQLNIRGLHD